MVSVFKSGPWPSFQVWIAGPCKWLESLIDWRIVTPPDTCPSCGQPRPDRYCGHCGERATEPDELSFSRFLRSLAEEIVPSFDVEEDQPVKRMGGRVYRTAYTLFRHPGQLTADYIRGRRRPYMKPVQVFLVISLLFFLFGDNYFRFTLGEYENVPIYGETFDAVAAEQQRLGLSADGYASVFNERLVSHKKLVMALTVPIFALGFRPLFRRRRYGEHLVFSIHFFALSLLFMITVMFAIFRVVLAVARAIYRVNPELANTIGRGLDSEVVIVLLLYVPMFCYLMVALRRVYGDGLLVNAGKALVLVIWHIAMLIIVFKNVLFFTTYYSLKWFG
ncbi:MAG TPA: DUF3667 domain-containing protein [Longimicrobiales bacterium]|nr:DUF3667 domain-containing protein [Longimicrobiales bacterium]